MTTRKGRIQRRHASALRLPPRVSLNGDYQHPRYVKVFLNGAAFAFANRRAGSTDGTVPLDRFAAPAKRRMPTPMKANYDCGHGKCLFTAGGWHGP